MVKIRIHLLGNEMWDDDVSLDISLPAIPRIGEFVSLDKSMIDDIFNQVKNSDDYLYYSEIWGEEDGYFNLTPMLVNMVGYECGEDFVRIELIDVIDHSEHYTHDNLFKT